MQSSGFDQNNNLTNSKLPKSSGSVAVPSSECYITCMCFSFFLFLDFVLVFLLSSLIISLAFWYSDRQIKKQMKYMLKWFLQPVNFISSYLTTTTFHDLRFLTQKPIQSLPNMYSYVTSINFDFNVGLGKCCVSSTRLWTKTK